MDMQNADVNDTPAIYEEMPCAIETPEEVANRWATEHGVKVSWSETVDGIEMCVETLANAKSRREEKNN
jgi:hypothetical protein